MQNIVIFHALGVELWANHVFV